MTEIRDDTLRDLIRLIPPARALKKDLEKSLHLEFYPGTGDLAVRSYKGLHASVSKLTDDPYVEAISMSVPEKATDKEKVALVLLAVGQLLAYLEGQTGLVDTGGTDGPVHIVTAPQIMNVSGLSRGGVDKVVDMAAKVLKDKEEKEENKTEQ